MTVVDHFDWAHHGVQLEVLRMSRADLHKIRPGVLLDSYDPDGLRLSMYASAMSIDVAIGVTSRAVWASMYPPWRAAMSPVASWSIDASGASAPPS
jgi:hypothetical protein